MVQKPLIILKNKKKRTNPKPMLKLDIHLPITLITHLQNKTFFT